MAEDDPWAEDPEFLAEVVVSRYERQRSQTEVVNAMPLYPTEAILWDNNQVPQVHYTGARRSLLLTLLLACSCPPVENLEDAWGRSTEHLKGHGAACTKRHPCQGK